DNAVRVIIFIGEGRAFCAGDNLKGYSAAPPDSKLLPSIPPGHDNALGTYNSLRHISQALNLTIRKLDKITIAAINGIAIQTGLSLALACDFKIAADSARLGSATLRFGLLPDEGGHYLLLEHLGLAKTMDFLMKKTIASASDALELGLVNEVVPLAQLKKRVSDLALELSQGPQIAMRMLKRSLYQATSMSFEQACEDIATRTAVTDHHADAREGGSSFREKRSPVFNRWLEDE
ncbi:MAG: enoyl-CoA hydratase-related protein, partial [Pseudomonadales bacterium]|nr:enoyl-CoA hydratase-related protein [Pseudomonadales bacterium]